MRRQNLLTQVLLANLILMVAAVVAIAIAGNPSLDVSAHPALALILGLAVVLMILVNVMMLQRRFRPLERLVEEMERVDLSRPGANLRIPADGLGASEEVERLNRAFRRMLARLEAERRRTSSTALAAQEQERARVARDLHDEVNQSLTGLLLRLEAARAKAPVEVAHELAETKALANQAMEELLLLARQLRPTALDDLGLKAALAGHVKELGRRTSIDADFESEGNFLGLPADVQLVVYRVAQEALSNAAQHSGADHVRVRLVRAGDRVELVVEDDGSGFTFDEAARGLGIAGMRERALLVDGDVQVESRLGTGTSVRLTVPLEDAGAPSGWKGNGQPRSRSPRPTRR
ncbi:MAG TPA: sensor histidine kinase [Solirubrobacterales bacterium]|jgi:two-component system sensor histidine kinase UhpB|nr:sensor histidine kinase [Solirubrobacterales bacterium]